MDQTRLCRIDHGPQHNRMIENQNSKVFGDQDDYVAFGTSFISCTIVNFVGMHISEWCINLPSIYAFTYDY